ncbi:MAG: Lrp/AsnC family transcriptional regulator [Acidobacteriia bacterium]|nr:Lrp/AsnC family transcriptional regulator [Terriglobia bacterium]
MYDEINAKLLIALQNNARASFAELGRIVGLTLPAVTERVRRLEEDGLIRGYHVDYSKLGYTISAFIRMKATPQKYPQLHGLARSIKEIRECHHLSGEDSFMLRVHAESVADLESIIQRLSEYGTTATAIVLSSPVMK